VYAEAQGAGVGLQNFISRLRTIPDVATAFQMLDGMGGAGQLIGWIDDAGIIVVKGQQAPSGGLALVTADDATAADKVKTLTGLIGFAGLGGNSVQSRQSTIAGVTVTTITLSNLSALVPPGQLPPGVNIPSDAKVEFSIAAKGKVILISTGEDFMTAVLNTQPGSSLADQATYKQATSSLLDEVAKTGTVPQITDAQRAQARADLAYWRADCVALTHVPNEGSLRTTLEALLGPGTPIVDVWTWKISR